MVQKIHSTLFQCGHFRGIQEMRKITACIYIFFMSTSRITDRRSREEHS